MLAPPGAARRMPGTAPALPKERVTATATALVLLVPAMASASAPASALATASVSALVSLEPATAATTATATAPVFPPLRTPKPPVQRASPILRQQHTRLQERTRHPGDTRTERSRRRSFLDLGALPGAAGAALGSLICKLSLRRGARQVISQAATSDNTT